jgi:rubrerythrin
MTHPSEGKQEGKNSAYTSSTAMTGQNKGKGSKDPLDNLGKAPAQEQDMPDLRERMAQRVEEEHRKLVEEELIYEKRHYREAVFPHPC